MPSENVPQVAYLYEVDDDGRPIRGSKQSANKNREKPKISQRDSRSGKPRKSHSDGGVTQQQEYDQISPGTKAIDGGRTIEKEGKLERRKSSASTKSPRKLLTRPPSVHENRGFPKGSTPREDPSYFGISQQTWAPPVLSQPMPLRPRPTSSHSRPLSYSAAPTSAGHMTGPPLSASAYYQQQIPPSYPPPTPSYIFNAAPPGRIDYFSMQPPNAARTLSSRFDPVQRTTSAFGTRDALPRQMLDNAYDDGYTSTSEGPKRVSIRGPSIRTKAEADYDSMPPPPRPGILRRRATEYHEDDPDQPSYRRPPSRSVYREEPSPIRRPSNRRNSVSYDLGPEPERIRVFETANNSRRRSSYYGPSIDSTGSSGYEEKVAQAASYQEDVGGGPSLPLTAEVLKRQQRRQAGSSRSTKSSGSRDESDYRKSATTRTTRSGSGPDDENVTIKVTGQARVSVGGAQIHCEEGGEIEIKRQKSIRNGSERSNSEYGGGTQYGDERRRIDDRERTGRAGGGPIGRSRMSSQSGYERTRLPQYPPGQEPWF